MPKYALGVYLCTGAGAGAGVYEHVRLFHLMENVALLKRIVGAHLRLNLIKNLVFIRFVNFLFMHLW